MGKHQKIRPNKPGRLENRGYVWIPRANWYQVDLVLPDVCYQAMRTMLQELGRPKYFLVDARIEDIMEKSFLNEHVKTGKTPPIYRQPVS